MGKPCFWLRGEKCDWFGKPCSDVPPETCQVKAARFRKEKGDLGPLP